MEAYKVLIRPVNRQDPNDFQLSLKWFPDPLLAQAVWRASGAFPLRLHRSKATGNGGKGKRKKKAKMKRAEIHVWLPNSKSADKLKSHYSRNPLNGIRVITQSQKCRLDAFSDSKKVRIIGVDDETNTAKVLKHIKKKSRIKKFEKVSRGFTSPKTNALKKISATPNEYLVHCLSVEDAIELVNKVRMTFMFVAKTRTKLLLWAERCAKETKYGRRRIDKDEGEGEVNKKKNELEVTLQALSKLNVDKSKKGNAAKIEIKVVEKAKVPNRKYPERSKKRNLRKGKRRGKDKFLNAPQTKLQKKMAALRLAKEERKKGEGPKGLKKLTSAMSKVTV